MNDLVMENLKLVKKVISDFNFYWRTEDEFQDLYDAGLLGLIYGAKKYDGSTKPSTYLYPCIKNEICKYINASKFEKRKIHKEIMVSLDDYIKGSDVTYGEMIEDIDTNVEEDLIKKLEIEKLLYAIDNCLTPLQKEYVCNYYGINGCKPMTLEQVGKKFNCCRQNVEDKLKSARKRLKKYLEKHTRDMYVYENRKKEKSKTLKDVLKGLMQE